MSRSAAGGRLHRLDVLESRLKADEPLTLGRLAAELGVSVRTLARDVAILRERGVPLEADRGRGGGLRLDRRWAVGRLQLNYREAIDLLVSLAVAEELQLAHLASIRHKLAASFGPELRTRVAALRKRILIGPLASTAVLGGFALPARAETDRVFRAFVERRRLRFAYVDGAGARSRRLAEPQLLVLNFPVWYLTAWDCERHAVRSFRLDRIGQSVVESEAFALRPAHIFRAAVEEDGLRVL